jgi:hypothetical protein
MGNYPVKKCTCCEIKLSRVGAGRLSAEYVEDVKQGLKTALGGVDAKGTAQIAVHGGMILGAVYNYANADEEKHSDKICAAIAFVLQDVEDAISETEDLIYVDVT